MIGNIKAALMEDTDKIIKFLELYGYCNFRIRNKYISFGRDNESSPKALVIRIHDNNSAFVVDYARGLNTDIISLIVKQKGVSYKEVVASALTIVDGADFKSKGNYKVFGGLLELKKRKTVSESSLKVLDESVISEYPLAANKRFFKDGISTNTQEFFGIRFDQEANDILIPIYDTIGRLIGVKARKNYEDPVKKYYYREPCSMSQTLYGYSHNYEHLVNAPGVVIVEAEKSIMQAYDFGFRQIVALGSSSLSKKQSKLIAQLNTKKIILMMDKGIKKEAIFSNVDILKKSLLFREAVIYIWEPGRDIPNKASPTDLGEERFFKSMREELIKWEDYEGKYKSSIN